jgi:hypothetical protein
MSYRNPLIIDDKSDIAGAQDITNVGNTFASIINTKNERARLAKEKKDKEDALISKQVINMANKKAEGDAQFVAGLTDLGGTIQSTLGAEYEKLSQSNFELRQLQLAGDGDPEISKQIGQNMQKMLEARTLGEQMIATTGELGELIDNYEAINKTIFLQDMEDPNTGEVNGNLSKAIIFGFGGKKDYTASMVNVDGELRAQVITPEGVTYSIPAKQFKDITENLTLEKINNAAEAQMQFTNNELKDKKGNINQSLINDKTSYNRTGSDGIQRIGTRNLLDLTAVKTARSNATMDTKALLTSVEGNTQLRNLYLDDLKISSVDYEAADKEGKAKMVTDKANELFDRTSGITMRNGNYYNDNVSKSFKAETPKVEGTAKEDLAFTEWKETFNTSDDLTAASFNLGMNTKVGNQFLTDATFKLNTVILETKSEVIDDDTTPDTNEAAPAKTRTYNLVEPEQLDAFVRLLPGVSTAKERSEAKALITAKIKNKDAPALTLGQLNDLKNKNPVVPTDKPE